MANKRDISIVFRAKDATARAFTAVQKRMQSMRDSVADFAGSIKGLLLGGTLAAITRFGVQAATGFEKLSASLKTVTGSAEAANDALSELKTFAKETPLSVEELTEAFITLKGRGLDPSIQALNAYGNVALGLGKTLDQFIEAVADAVTGEFERLKEFGIKARKQGEQVTFTFRGVTTEVKNNAEDIETYLRRLGEVEFAGGMEEQAKTLGGAFNKLAGAVTQLADKVFRESGFIALLQEAVGNLNEMASAAIGPADAIEKINEQIVELKENREKLSADNTSLVDAVLGDTGAGRLAEIDKINNKIEELRNNRLELLKGRKERKAQSERQAQEQAHNQRMDELREKQTENLETWLDVREEIMRRHTDNLKKFQSDQEEVAKDFASILKEVLGGGVDDKAIERFELLSRLADVRGDFGAGNFAEAISGAREGLELLKDYKEQTGASRQDVLLLAEGFRQLFEAAQEAESARLEEAAGKGLDAYEEVQRKLKEKALTANVESEDGTGQQIRDKIQQEIDQSGEVIIDVGIRVNTVNGELGLSPGSAADIVLERESDKRGYRL